MWCSMLGFPKSNKLATNILKQMILIERSVNKNSTSITKCMDKFNDLYVTPFRIDLMYC